MLAQITSYLGRMRSLLPSLRAEGYYVPYLYWDFLMCFFKYGCVLDQYVRGGFYKMSSYERRRSMTYKRILYVYDKCITPDYIHFLQNKIDFNRYFSSIIRRKWLYGKDMSENDFDALCHSAPALIVKPLNESEGRGIRKIIVPETVDGAKIVFASLTGQEVIIEECLVSHKDMVFGSSSLNTLRVHSLLDCDGNVHFMKFILRVGVGDSVVDNYCAGGCIYEIDEETGCVISKGYSKVHPESIVHPGTEIIMLGRQIPFWQEVKELVCKAHKMIPQMRFIGWDVAITGDGPELIEGNHHPDYDLLEFVGTRLWCHKIKKYL